MELWDGNRMSYTKEKNLKKAILFDLDGTLWDSSEQCTEAWNECLCTQTNLTKQIIVDDMHGYMGKTIEAIAALMLPELSKGEQLRIIKLCTDNEQVYLQNHKAKLYPDEYEILSELSEDYELGIVSNCQDGYIQIYLVQCGFAELFCDFESAGKTEKSKGENIRLVMERQGIDKCVYIGDTQGDCDAAAEAGIPFIHASYGFGRVDNAVGVLTKLSDLREILKSIGI